VNSPTDAVTVMLHAVDELDWATVRACFADEVATDYTSLWGGEPERLSGDDIVGWWEQLAPGYDATQHLTGPLLVTEETDDRVACTTKVRAYHHVVEDAGRSTWIVAGRYVIELESGPDGWRIGAITLRLEYEDGDRRLVDVAKARCAAGHGGRVAD
jgi:SnoaL-like domain